MSKVETILRARLTLLKVEIFNYIKFRYCSANEMALLSDPSDIIINVLDYDYKWVHVYIPRLNEHFGLLNHESIAIHYIRVVKLLQLLENGNSDIELLLAKLAMD